MTDIELLPLPKWLLEGFTDQTIERLCDYARANVAHATAAKDAEIERLRAEREVIGAEAVKYAGKSGRLEAKVERLAEALRDVRAVGRDDDGDYAHRGEHHATCVAIAERALLRDHDQEGGDA